MPDLTLERELQLRGVNPVAGVDEAGRGPLAGPVVAAAVVLPPNLTGSEPWLNLLDDSKRLSPAQRLRAVEAVHEHAAGVGVAMSSPQEIDAIGIGPATVQAMMRAVECLRLAAGTPLAGFCLHLQLFPALRHGGPRGQPQLFHCRRLKRGQGDTRPAYAGSGRMLSRLFVRPAQGLSNCGTPGPVEGPGPLPDSPEFLWAR